MMFDHIGIVAADPRAGRTMLASAFRVARWTEEFADPLNDVFVQFGVDPSGLCYETIAPLSDNSPVARAARDGVNIINHTAYLVDNLDEEARRLRRAGFSPTAGPRPAVAFGGKNVQFFLCRHRLMLELIEAPGHRHQFARPTPREAAEMLAP